jgi:hypothetical protein
MKIGHDIELCLWGTGTQQSKLGTGVLTTKKYNWPRYSTCSELQLREALRSNNVIWCTVVDSSFSTTTINVWRLGLLEEFKGMASTLIFHPSRNFEKSISEKCESIIFIFYTSHSKLSRAKLNKETNLVHEIQPR